MAGDGQLRLRSACDPCSVAKVGCDKNRPCKRCVRINVPCSYSESRKHGKQSLRRKLAQARAKRATTTLNGLPLAAAAVSSLESEPFQSLTHTDTSALFSLWPDGDSAGTEVDMETFTNWDMADQLPFSTTLHLRSKAGEERQDIFTLQHMQVLPGTASCSTDPAHYAEFNLIPSFDRVLSTNRAALDGWMKLMRCSCVQCPHLTLLYVSVLNRMLFWYRIAAKEQEDGDCEDTNCSNSNSGSSGNSDGSSNGGDSGPTTPSLSPPTVDQFGVQATIIKVGLFSLDTEDQANLRQFLLMRELRRMEAAIEELMNVDRTDMQESVDEKAWSAVKWSLDGILRVRDELRDVVKTLPTDYQFDCMCKVCITGNTMLRNLMYMN
ncbi:hypothetical protein F5Y16DRAFT_413353 [Xylariaceae sp. FL0255]|nr:hypothetical protein F5Y16DRAFT_413353 [Xylariaceae sp. FL0255]